eukprot:PRCOL_00003429-RA
MQFSLADLKYAPKFKSLKNAVAQKFGNTVEVDGAPTPTTSGAMEVTVDGKLVHSKLNGDGHIDSVEKINKIFDAIAQAM